MIEIKEVKIIHGILIEKFGGAKGIRDIGALESAINRPFQRLRISWSTMKNKMKEQWKGMVTVAVVLPLVLVPFSLVLGWNILTLLLFWFAIVPALTIYLPAKVSKQTNHLVESLVGMTIFYGFMVFMTYSHYKTDYFQVMMTSYIVNIVMVTALTLLKKPNASPH